MNTLTKEWLQNTITGIESIIDDKSFVCSEIAFEIGQVNNILTAFKIALASLAAKPVVYMWDSERKDIDAPGYYRTEHLVFAESSVKKWGGRVVPLYTAPPATVVPDERAAFNAWNNDENLPIAGVGAKNAAWLAWQARAELGRSLAVNSPVTPDGWISCSERMPNDKQYVWCWGKSYGWAECNTFEGYYDWSRNKWWAVTDDGEEPASKVTHWMPLPEPPQEVK
ncbi:DUF551 domain-containing protein [Escherichia coli]|nr:DUF551 domain-containing protein [Escherichia coli]EHW2916423.1 DUF551 domain-containing protein [Escherichia coli]EJL3868188.1 DUF551 domain-containing protein [Escherichia coli]HBB5757671.1 DUF551 domain-containing protein [Escherichia coli]HBB5809682.1 DUF551 domain-containing protein [Escherichia coli]